ncbi:hypothetical protein CIK66_16965 [Brachybacterium alimentarium]|uniref:Uncharacterized protein n=1 Tax=Brachybacterium alimentarium TaxID=47845 RepID=A0A2A3YF43_9MICO|nr:hypothetical protein [Brachybacterium alimentarium]PCC37888.1 hypothetical protein CIK66_16965 [Brachybacterium alimentarium]
MASLVESVRKLHGPKLVEHDNGYDVDVICPECTRLRTEALERASTDGEGWGYGVELARVPYPCPTRIVAGTNAVEGKDESARMRLEHLVVQREELEERMERLDAVIGLIRRDLGETSAEVTEMDKAEEKKLGKSSSAESEGSAAEVVSQAVPSKDAGSDMSDADSELADDYDF